MDVLHKALTRESNSFMGSGHSISDGTSSHQLEPCFTMMHAFPDKVMGSLAALLSRDRVSTCEPDPMAPFETPTGMPLDPTQKWAAAPYLPTTTSPTNHGAGSSIKKESNSAHHLEDPDFILIHPKMLSNKPRMEILEQSEVAAYPRFRPRTRAAPTEREHLAAQQLSDLDRLLLQETTSCRDKFIPIRDTDEEDSLPDEATGVQQPTFDSLKSGEVSSFKLKPRRSRNPWDYKFTW